jgi:hypothetical protein
MSPKFYSFLWVLYFVAAGIMWLAGVLTMMAIVVFGFIAFGMVFMGMMCVLPGAVSHPTPKKSKMPKSEKTFKPAPAKPAKTVGGFSTYRSV